MKAQRAMELPSRTPSQTDEPRKLKLQEEAFGSIVTELPPLFARIKGIAKFPVDPDWARLLRFALSGNLRVLTLRFNGALVGIAMSTIGPHLMSKTLVQAMTLLVWIDPAYRWGWLGVKFLKANRNMLKRAGATRLCIAHASHDLRLAAAFRRVGYKVDEFVYTQVT